MNIIKGLSFFSALETRYCWLMRGFVRRLDRDQFVLPESEVEDISVCCLCRLNEIIIRMFSLYRTYFFSSVRYFLKCIFSNTVCNATRGVIRTSIYTCSELMVAVCFSYWKRMDRWLLCSLVLWVFRWMVPVIYLTYLDFLSDLHDAGSN